jgi:hypothetical protein
MTRFEPTTLGSDSNFLFINIPNLNFQLLIPGHGIVRIIKIYACLHQSYIVESKKKLTQLEALI